MVQTFATCCHPNVHEKANLPATCYETRGCPSDAQVSCVAEAAQALAATLVRWAKCLMGFVDCNKLLIKRGRLWDPLDTLLYWHVVASIQLQSSRWQSFETLKNSINYYSFQSRKYNIKKALPALKPLTTSWRAIGSIVQITPAIYSGGYFYFIFYIQCNSFFTCIQMIVKITQN